LYGSKLVKIPTPQFVVFYNGVRTVEERQIICLSDAFERKTKEPALELKVLVLNINQGYNMNLMSACKKLNDYTIYVAKIRKYVKMNIKLEDAINKAIDECIDENVLREYLLKHRNEVYEMSVFECTDEEIIDAIKESEYDLGHEAGKVEGIKEGIEEGQLMTLVKLVQTGIITEEQAANNLSISKEEFEKILNEKIAKNISE
jgi:predicted transposase YdaD